MQERFANDIGKIAAVTADSDLRIQAKDRRIKSKIAQNVDHGFYNQIVQFHIDTKCRKDLAAKLAISQPLLPIRTSVSKHQIVVSKQKFQSM